VECRRRVKEQMNKRKPDNEFANIDLSYITPDGHQFVVYCPESKNAQATQRPVRRELEKPTGLDLLKRGEISNEELILPSEAIDIKREGNLSSVQDEADVKSNHRTRASSGTAFYNFLW